MAKHMQGQGQPVKVRLIVAVVVAVVGVGVACWWLLSRQAADADNARQTDEAGATSNNAVREDAGVASSSLSDEVQADEAQTEFARMIAAGQIHSVRLVGDSITAGFGTDGYDEAVAADDDAQVIYDDGSEQVTQTPASVHCWANAFRSWAAEHGVDDFVNAGINGAFMSRLSEHPDAWLQGGADVVVVALGTNDAGYVGTDEFIAQAREGIGVAAEQSKLVVVMAPVRDLRPEYMLVEPASELGDALQELCEQEGYVFVDPRDAVTPQMFNDDGLHPTSEGSLAIWQCLRQTLGV